MLPAMANGIAETAPATISVAPPATWRTEDWIAVYLGFFVILATLVLFNSKSIDLGQLVPSFRWTTDGQIASRAPDWSAALETAPAAAPLRQALLSNDRKAIEAAAGQLAKVAGRNTVAGTLAAEIRGHAGEGVRLAEPLESAVDPAGRGRGGGRSAHRRKGRRVSRGFPGRVRAGMARARARRQRAVHRLRRRVRDLRAAHGPAREQHPRRSRLAQARGADRG